MKFKKVLFFLGLALLCFLSGEILVRRWVWHQVPSQLHPLFVYGLLLLNVVSVVFFTMGSGKKLEKS